MTNKRIQTRRLRHTDGFTLVECMLAALVLMVVLGGIMTFRYYTVFSAESAENQILAARAACLLSEAWRGQKGDAAFDPLQQDFDDDFQISEASGTGESITGMSSLGNYDVELDGKEFTAQLLYRKVTGVDELLLLQVVIRWKDHRGVQQHYYLPTFSQTAA